MMGDGHLWKVKVNSSKCTGCEICTSICPQVFKLTKTGKAKTIVKEIDDFDLYLCVDELAAACPVEAIEVYWVY